MRCRRLPQASAPELRACSLQPSSEPTRSQRRSLSHFRAMIDRRSFLLESAVAAGAVGPFRRCSPGPRGAPLRIGERARATVRSDRSRTRTRSARCCCCPRLQLRELRLDRRSARGRRQDAAVARRHGGVRRPGRNRVHGSCAITRSPATTAPSRPSAPRPWPTMPPPAAGRRRWSSTRERDV